MKKNDVFTKFQILFILFLLFSLSTTAQVGIGTTTPNADALLDIDASVNVGGLLLPRMTLTATNNAAPLGAHVQGMSVYNTASVNDVTPGQYYNDGSKWVRVQESTNIDSVTLATDEIINTTSYTNINSMTLTFIAKKTSILVNLTASGLGYTNSLGTVNLRVINTTSGTTVGGTNTKIQSLFDDVGVWSTTSYSVTTWSCSFSKLMIGLTIGNTYSLRVQGSAITNYGTNGAAVFSSTQPDSSHLTLSVIQ